jgi:hypothetical protein
MRWSRLPRLPEPGPAGSEDFSGGLRRNPLVVGQIVWADFSEIRVRRTLRDRPGIKLLLSHCPKQPRTKFREPATGDRGKHVGGGTEFAQGPFKFGELRRSDDHGQPFLPAARSSTSTLPGILSISSRTSAAERQGRTFRFRPANCRFNSGSRQGRFSKTMIPGARRDILNSGVQQAVRCSVAGRRWCGLWRGPIPEARR